MFCYTIFNLRWTISIRFQVFWLYILNTSILAITFLKIHKWLKILNTFFERIYFLKGRELNLINFEFTPSIIPQFFINQLFTKNWTMFSFILVNNFTVQFFWLNFILCSMTIIASTPVCLCWMENMYCWVLKWVNNTLLNEQIILYVKSRKKDITF